MLKPYFILLLLPLPILLAACAPRVGNDLENYRMPTDVPGAASLTETAQAEATASTPPESCPVTVPQDPLFVPPPPYSEMEFEGYFWYGSNSLWAALPENGVWSELPQDSHGYTQKIPWWREGYVWNEEPEPPLQVTGERLDAKAPPMEASSANGAYAAEFGSAMMMGANFPTPGCWKITGNYEGTELSFVVWIAP
jgi:hypothetical protein